jgi:hypothetical protein
MVLAKRRMPKLADFLREARAYHPEARSPHFARLAALRAEMLYGLPADEAYRRITGGKENKKPVPDHKRDEKAIVETMVEMETYGEGQPPPWMRGRDPIDRAFEEHD